MSKFKIGDRVVVTVDSGNPDNFNVVGAVGTVLDDSPYSITLVDFGKPHGERNIGVERLELAPKQPLVAPAPPPAPVFDMTIDPSVVLALVGQYVKDTYGIDQKVSSVEAYVEAYSADKSMHKFGTPVTCKIGFAR